MELNLDQKPDRKGGNCRYSGRSRRRRLAAPSIQASAAFILGQIARIVSRSPERVRYGRPA